jgi:hypothetical protein
LNFLSLKISTFAGRLTGYFRHVPVRAVRIWNHFKIGLSLLSGRKKDLKDLSPWWAGLFFYLLDLLAVPEMYETAVDFGKWDTRPLTPGEVEMARSVFGDTIPLEKVRVDESARIGCRRWHVIYVSFFTINAWGKFHPEILIHELVHVWQYLNMGSIYIPRALYAQTTAEGYNYGGVPALKDCLRRGGSLRDFNLEQQADIISDYFCIREGRQPRWGTGGPGDLPVYEKFVREIRAGSTIGQKSGESGLSSK